LKYFPCQQREKAINLSYPQKYSAKYIFEHFNLLCIRIFAPLWKRYEEIVDQLLEGSNINPSLQAKRKKKGKVSVFQ